MGTSSSYGGPTGNNPLLPPWAQPNSPPPLPPGGVTPPVPVQPAPTQIPTPPTAPASPTAAPQFNFRRAKVAMTRFVTGGGGRQGVSRAAKAYVGARGGSRGSARAATAGRAATQNFGSFLSSVASRGAEAALRDLGLSSFAGKPAAQVLAEIANRLAPNGATLEEAAARRAMDDALFSLYERYDLEDGNLSRLEAMDASAIREAVQESICSYIFHRWLQELGDRIEQKAVSADQAVGLEREVRDYVRDAVKLDLSQVDVLTMDWKSPAGSGLVERVFQEAYSLLEPS